MCNVKFVQRLRENQAKPGRDYGNEMNTQYTLALRMRDDVYQHQHISSDLLQNCVTCRTPPRTAKREKSVCQQSKSTVRVNEESLIRADGPSPCLPCRSWPRTRHRPRPRPFRRRSRRSSFG